MDLEEEKQKTNYNNCKFKKNLDNQNFDNNNNIFL
jgi:hypothetical protein